MVAAILFCDALMLIVELAVFRVFGIVYRALMFLFIMNNLLKLK